VLGLYRALLAASPASHKVLVAPVDVVLSDDTVIQPDVIVTPVAAFTEADLPVPPLLAVEVLSSSTRGVDLLLKRERLRIAGCAHYWVFDPDETSLIAWMLVGDDYVEVARARGHEPVRIELPFLVEIIPADLIS
jgi:Uma2 family endonuclease